VDWRSIANRPRALYDVTLNGDSLAVIASVTAVSVRVQMCVADAVA